MKVKLEKNERLDDLHINNYKIIQNKEKFCFGMDAVLLSSFVSVREDEVVLDLGTGTGIIPILLEAKTKGKIFYALEIQEDMVHMATRSLLVNDLDKKILITCGDIKEAYNIYPLSSFDVITCNPPYMNSGKGLTNNLTAKAIARHEIYCTLEDVIYSASRLLKVKGRFYMVHRPHRLAEIIKTLQQNKLEPKRIRFVYPYVNKEANMVLIEAIRHGKPMVKIEPPLIVYSDLNKYSKEIYDIYGYPQSIN